MKLSKCKYLKDCPAVQPCQPRVTGLLNCWQRRKQPCGHAMVYEINVDGISICLKCAWEGLDATV